jgi:hypothetical protein
MHHNHLVLLNTQAQALLFDYDPLNKWLAERKRVDVASVGYTAHAILIFSLVEKSVLEDEIRSLLAPQDSFRVVRVKDFEWPSALPDDETLKGWLEERTDWQQWSSGH